jgi:hypothetical protein
MPSLSESNKIRNLVPHPRYKLISDSKLLALVPGMNLIVFFVTFIVSWKYP